MADRNINVTLTANVDDLLSKLGAAQAAMRQLEGAAADVAKTTSAPAQTAGVDKVAAAEAALGKNTTAASKALDKQALVIKDFEGSTIQGEKAVSALTRGFIGATLKMGGLMTPMRLLGFAVGTMLVSSLALGAQTTQAYTDALDKLSATSRDAAANMAMYEAARLQTNAKDSSVASVINQLTRLQDWEGRDQQAAATLTAQVAQLFEDAGIDANLGAQKMVDVIMSYDEDLKTGLDTHFSMLAYAAKENNVGANFIKMFDGLTRTTGNMFKKLGYSESEMLNSLARAVSRGWDVGQITQVMNSFLTNLPTNVSDEAARGLWQSFINTVMAGDQAAIEQAMDAYKIRMMKREDLEALMREQVFKPIGMEGIAEEELLKYLPKAVDSNVTAALELFGKRFADIFRKGLQWWYDLFTKDPAKDLQRAVSNPNQLAEIKRALDALPKPGAAIEAFTDEAAQKLTELWVKLLPDAQAMKGVMESIDKGDVVGYEKVYQQVIDLYNQMVKKFPLPSSLNSRTPASSSSSSGSGIDIVDIYESYNEGLKYLLSSDEKAWKVWSAEIEKGRKLSEQQTLALLKQAGIAVGGYVPATEPQVVSAQPSPTQAEAEKALVQLPKTLKELIAAGPESSYAKMLTAQAGVAKLNPLTSAVFGVSDDIWALYKQVNTSATDSKRFMFKAVDVLNALLKALKVPGYSLMTGPEGIQVASAFGTDYGGSLATQSVVNADPLAAYKASGYRGYLDPDQGGGMADASAATAEKVVTDAEKIERAMTSSANTSWRTWYWNLDDLSEFGRWVFGGLRTTVKDAAYDAGSEAPKLLYPIRTIFGDLQLDITELQEKMNAWGISVPQVFDNILTGAKRLGTEWLQKLGLTDNLEQAKAAIGAFEGFMKDMGVDLDKYMLWIVKGNTEKLDDMVKNARDRLMKLAGSLVTSLSEMFASGKYDWESIWKKTWQTLLSIALEFSIKILTNQEAMAAAVVAIQGILKGVEGDFIKMGLYIAAGATIATTAAIAIAKMREAAKAAEEPSPLSGGPQAASYTQMPMDTYTSSPTYANPYPPVVAASGVNIEVSMEGANIYGTMDDASAKKIGEGFTRALSLRGINPLATA